MKTKSKITWLAIVAVVSVIGAYFSIRSAVVSNMEIAALTNTEGLTALEYLKEHANDRSVFGFTYNNSKRMDNDEGILDLTIRLGDGEKPASFSPDDPVIRSINSLRYRLDWAGFPAEMTPADSGRYRFRITYVIDPYYVKRLMRENIEIGIWETIPPDLYSGSDTGASDPYSGLDADAVDEPYSGFDTDIVEGIDDRLSGSFSPYESGEGRSPAWGYAARQDTAGIIELFSEQFQPHLPRYTRFRWGPCSHNGEYLDLYCLHSNNRGGGPLMTVGDHARVVKIEPVSDYPEDWAVNIELDSQGAKIWSQITNENIGRSIAITFNDSIWMVATVMDRISDGKMQLRGFTYDDAVAVRSIIRAGNLKLPVQIVNEQYAPLILNEKTAKTGFCFALIASCILFGLILFSMVMIVRAIVKKYPVKKPDPATIPEAGQPRLQNADKQVNHNNWLFIVLCIVFGLISVGFLIMAFSSLPLKISETLYASVFTVITVAFFRKSATGWFFMLSYWLILVVIAVGITLYSRFNMPALYLIVFGVIVVPVIVALFSGLIKRNSFGITASNAFVARRVLIYMVVLIILWLIPIALNVAFYGSVW